MDIKKSMSMPEFVMPILLTKTGIAFFRLDILDIIRHGISAIRLMRNIHLINIYAVGEYK